MCIILTVFLPFLVKPLMKLGLNVFPKRSLNFFIDVVDKSAEERKTSADDEEVCVKSAVLYFSVSK